MSGILSLLITITMVTLCYNSPIALAMATTIISMLAGLMIYSQSSYVFPAAAITISFSSGMMILFCYCAMLSNYEKKPNFISSMMYLSALFPLVLMISKSDTPHNSNPDSLSSLISEPFLSCGMIVVMLTMLCVNKAMFSPVKPMLPSY